MPEKSREIRPPEGSAWAEARGFGCDMDQLAHTLSLSVRERLHRHDRALSALETLRSAVEAKRAGA